MPSARNDVVGAREARPRRAGREAARRRLLSAEPTLLLLAGALLLPNALTILATVWIGVPPRSAPIAAYVVVVLVCLRLPRPAMVPLYLAVLAFDVMMIVSELFFLDFSSLREGIPALAHVRVLASPLYASLIAAIAAFAAINIGFFMRYKARMADGNKVVLALAVVGCLLGDILINSSANLYLGPTAGLGQPFQSAVQQSGFEALAEPAQPKRNVVLVLVESLGLLRDAHQRDMLFSAFDADALKAGFTVTTGTTSFFGATAYGEMRELCGSRASYTALLHENGPTCLPALFAARGYRTVSVHGFTRAFYDRASWYPKAGFVQSEFQDTTKTPYKRRCGGAFIGLCDVEIADAISDQLSTATQPLFVYWVTLNSHVPVIAGQATPRHDCRTGGPFGDPEVCAMAEIWEDLFAAIARLAIRNPATEILLVGDHAPPLWRRAARNRFEADRVPWIRLAPRAAPAVAMSPAKAPG